MSAPAAGGGFDPHQRSRQAEMMDDDSVDFTTFRGCLYDLSRVNRMSLGYRPTLLFLDQLLRAGRLPRDRPLRLVDVGSGYGDTLREIALWGRRHSVAVELTGVDRNPWAARAAAEATAEDMPITWVTSDVFEYRPVSSVDVVISALFTHHLDDLALLRFLRWMEQIAAIGWLVNDLHRHRLPYEAFKLASRALNMHRFVQHDGPVSFARSFVAADWRKALTATSVPPTEADIVWRTPFRLCVARVRPS